MSPTSTPHWDIATMDYPVRHWRLRYGALSPPRGTSIRASILYLQGLSDSMLNHLPFFEFLTQRGYRIIAFDYPGQGMSSGSMNQLRILPASHPQSIANIASKVWNIFYPDQPRIRNVIGWSTGGLAAYELCHQNFVDNAVLVAPALGIKILLDGKLITTYRCLTHANYTHGNNPHIDPIKPKSPLTVPVFSSRLLWTDRKARTWQIPKTVNGLVCIAGKNDPYVHAHMTQQIIQQHAAHFSIRSFENALHEIDNESDEIRLAFYEEVAGFLNSHKG